MTEQAVAAVAVPNPASAFKQLCEHIAEHGIEAQRLGDRGIRFTHEGCTLEFSHDDAELDISINAPSQNMLFFLKEAAASHIAEIDAVAGAGIRWSDDAGSGVEAGGRPLNFRELRLIESRDVLSNMVRLTLTGDNISDLGVDGLHVKLMLSANGQVNPTWPTVAANGVTVWPDGENALHVRYFTLRHVRLGDNCVDIDVVKHVGGKVADWASTAKIGDRIGVMGPGGGGIPEFDGRLLLSGDETALPAIARIIESLPPDRPCDLVIGMADDDKLEDYLSFGSQVAIHRLDSSVFNSRAVEVLHEVAEQNGRPAYAWFGGEFDTANAVRRLFKGEFGLTKGDQLSVAYWQRGREQRADGSD